MSVVVWQKWSGVGWGSEWGVGLCNLDVWVLFLALPLISYVILGKTNNLSFSFLI